jgi:6-pyruvoyl-tetrahydropterin synthase
VSNDLVTYDRTFILQACHMNGGDVYAQYSASMVAEKTGDWEQAYKHLKNVLPQIHGHNFKVRISANGKVGKEGYVIDDPLMEGILKKWDNINLSTLPEFGPAGVRATTENMAHIILDKMWKQFSLRSCRVEVWETDSICAVAEY